MKKRTLIPLVVGIGVTILGAWYSIFADRGRNRRRVFLCRNGFFVQIVKKRTLTLLVVGIGVIILGFQRGVTRTACTPVQMCLCDGGQGAAPMRERAARHTGDNGSASPVLLLALLPVLDPAVEAPKSFEKAAEGNSFC